MFEFGGDVDAFDHLQHLLHGGGVAVNDQRLAGVDRNQAFGIVGQRLENLDRVGRFDLLQTDLAGDEFARLEQHVGIRLADHGRVLDRLIPGNGFDESFAHGH